MKISAFKSIKTKLIFWFVFVSATLILASLVSTYFHRVSVIESRTFDKLVAIRDLKVERLQGWLGERVGDMKTISTDRELSELESVIVKTSLDQNSSKILSNVRRIIGRYLKNYSAYDKLFILNPLNGKIMVSTKDEFEEEDKSAEEYFTKPMWSQEFSITDIHMSGKTKKQAMFYSIPIFCHKHESKHVVGILVSQVDLKNSLFRILLNRTGLGETGETLIVNKDVMVLNDLRWHDDAPLKLQIKAGPAVNAAQGKTGIAITTDYRGEDVLAAYTYIPATGWGFVCKQDLYELNTPIREMIRRFALLFIIAVTASYIIALFISKTISRPIEALNKGAEVIGGGNLEHKIGTDAKDEIGKLSRSFDKMTENLKKTTTSVALLNKEIEDRNKAEEKLAKYREQLEELVKERTKNLKEKNVELNRYKNATIDREFRIKELRDENDALKKQAGQKDKPENE